MSNNSEITSIINWEGALLLPLGTNAWHIYDFAVHDSDDSGLLPIAKAFWTALIDHLPPASTPQALITAMQTGLVLNTFDAPDNNVNFHRMVSVYKWISDTFTDLL